MTQEELLARLKLIYSGDGEDMPFSDEALLEYLSLAEEEVISWMYSLVELPEDTSTIDTSQYDNVKIMAVIEALTIHGAEGQVTSTEGNFTRQFKYVDMIDYIHAHIVPFVGFGR